MVSRFLHIGFLIVVGLAVCASSTRTAVETIGLGMSKDEVQNIAGAPMAQAGRDHYQAWRYEYRVIGPCARMGGGRDGGGPACRQVCEHATVWFKGDEVRSITAIRVDSLEDCGQSSVPIFWEHMPDYVEGPGK